MSEDLLTRSPLWQNAFADRADGRDSDRRELEHALIQFRRRTTPLLSIIARDMPGYTVHDITHIDALWEMAEIVAGSDYELNPAEAFVFGGALLLHDAGMSIAAYSGGFAELRESNAWSDNAQAARRQLGIDVAITEDELLQRKDFLDIALTATLRDLHAEAAAKLIGQKWRVKPNSEPEFLLEQNDLRGFYGEAIGQIAASHHWDGKEVVAKLSVPLNAYPHHPSAWTVDKVKLALLLRCSDAAHIDARRAPRLLFALNRPQGISAEHWTFQSKIAKPRAIDGKLRYTSSAAFGVSEVDAWQLAWDTIRLIDRELGFADEILKQRKLPTFAVTGADGAKLPQALAQFVQVQGWTPILPEIMVSDVAHLAKTLGGHDLYSSEFTPLRELIQNAADAIEARTAVDRDFTLDDGKIIIRVNSVSEELIELIVEDNGIGMSERVLTGPLIDFGTSFWRSSLARSEYPGLQGKFREPRGRYGIGFFSVFMWAQDVVIASRPFSSGRSDTRLLQFSGGLNRRPILREALPEEELGETKTRVSLRVSKGRIERAFGGIDRRRAMELDPYSVSLLRRGMLGPLSKGSWKTLIALLCGILPIKVYLEERGERKLVNLPDWKTVGGERFISFLFDGPFRRAPSIYLQDVVERLSFIRERGEVVGRAFLGRGEDDFGGLMVYEKGIFVNFAQRGLVGVVEGKAIRADRESSTFNSPLENGDWIAEQEKKIFTPIADLGERLASQSALVGVGRINEDQPLFILNREIVSLTQAVEKLHTRKRVQFVFLEDTGDSGQFEWQVPESLSIVVGRRVTEHRLHPLVKLNQKIPLDFDFARECQAERQGAFGQIFRRIFGALGSEVAVKCETAFVGSYDRRRFLYVTCNAPQS